MSPYQPRHTHTLATLPSSPHPHTPLQQHTHQLTKAEAQKATHALETTLSETKATLEQTTTDAATAQRAWDAERTTLTTRVSELQARVDAAAAALHAADELRELKKKHKQEMAALTAQLKGATAASKGGEREGERLKKETDKLRDKIKSLEEALRGAKVEKTNALLEKANVERELKGLKDRAERLTKNLERSDSVHEKRRESMAVGLNKAKSALSETEEALAAARLSLEQTQFALTAKTGVWVVWVVVWRVGGGGVCVGGWHVCGGCPMCVYRCHTLASTTLLCIMYQQVSVKGWKQTSRQSVLRMLSFVHSMKSKACSCRNDRVWWRN